MGAPHWTLDAFAYSPDSLNCHLHLTDRRNVATKAVYSGTSSVSCQYDIVYHISKYNTIVPGNGDQYMINIQITR